MKLLDLFSGIGGFALGLERAGFETVAFCEVAPACRHLLAHHWPEVPIYDDVQTLTADRLGSDGIVVDAICGGFPCQDLSFAGKGAGLAGARSGLWSEFARLIRELRPRVVIVENVSALLSRGLGVVLGDLAASGYDAEWDCIPAAAVGAPHRRDRLWIVAYARGEQHEGFGDAFRRSVAAFVVDPDTEGKRRTKARRLRCDEPAQRPTSICEALANAEHHGLAERRGDQTSIACGARGGADGAYRPGGNVQAGQVLADAKVVGREIGPREQAGQSEPIVGGAGRKSWSWRSEPDVGRVAHGVPARVDRLHGLGNAVVPQIPEILGRAVLQARVAA